MEHVHTGKPGPDNYYIDVDKFSSVGRTAKGYVR
jgi:hypothetical protein